MSDEPKKTPRVSPATVFHGATGAQSPIQSSVVEIVNGLTGPAVMLGITDIPGLTANLDQLQQRIATQGTELREASERIDILNSRVTLTSLLLLVAIVLGGLEAWQLGWF